MNKNNLYIGTKKVVSISLKNSLILTIFIQVINLNQIYTNIYLHGNFNVQNTKLIIIFLTYNKIQF